MASVPVTLVGVAYDNKSLNATPVTIVAELSYQGLGIGGGPMPGGRPPLGIWGPTDPRPGTGLPGDQPYPGQGLPGNQPYPGQGLPGLPPYATTGPGFPTNPIVLPPIAPGGPPVQIWGPILHPDQGLPGAPVYPSHPIVYPPLPLEPPEGTKPPPENGGWGYVEPYGWGYFPMGGAAGPKAG